MQKLNQIQSYVLMEESKALTFKHPEGQALESRLIKMRVNAPQAVNLYLTRLDEVEEETGEIVKGEVHFLAHVLGGFEQLEFYYRGSFALNAVGGDIWLDTLDSSDFSLEATDYANYARVWEREERDPRILEMEQIARHNQRMLDEQRAADRAEREAMIEEMRKLREANVTTSSVDANRGTASPVPPVPAGPSGDDKGKQAPAGTGTGGEPKSDA